MKIILTIIPAILISAVQCFAQEQTLLGSEEISNGGFGGPVIKYVQINGEPGVLVGGRGGWIINHTFVLGGGGYGLVNDIRANAPNSIFPLVISDNYDTFINFGYGGVELEYIIQSDKVLHFSVYTLFGGGSVSYRNSYWNDFEDINFRDWESPHDEFFIFEPAVNAEVNIISFMRITAGFSYRFISGVHMNNLRNTDLAGPSGVLTFKFGKF